MSVAPQTSSEAGAKPSTKPRILCVDDEAQVLSALTLNLRRHFEVHTAGGGAEGLDKLAQLGGVAAVISDMRMPGMDGAEFLAQVRRKSPDTVRMLLTGYSEIDAAIAAINEGQIFRFLTKPCSPDTLIGAVQAAVEQYRLVTSERVLLEQTLHGSIKTLIEILSLQNPVAFGRATRAKTRAAALITQLEIPGRWAIEMAAMLFPIGTITLPHETAEKVAEGKPLTSVEQDMVKRVPEVTERLLASIPRLEPVREILNQLQSRFDGEGGNRKGTDLPVGARMLRILLDYDVLETQNLNAAAALETMGARRGIYDPDLLAAFATLLGNRLTSAQEQDLLLAQLRPTMVFLEDVRSKGGGLLVARGHEITDSLIERLWNVARNVGIHEPMKVLVPPQAAKRKA